MRDDAVLIRPMLDDDVEEAEEVSADAFLAADVETSPRGGPEPERRPRDRAPAWCARTRHVLQTDPGGCWVSERGGTMLGFATSMRRDLTWILSTYAVRPDLRGMGLGRPLLGAALQHSRGCLRAMLAASDDPRALRLYKQAGFDLHPQLCFRGELDRSRIPEVRHVREGSLSDLDLLDSLDRRVRDAAHGRDHELLAADHRLLVLDRAAAQGYAWVAPGGAPVLLAATGRRAARDLLWEALASAPLDSAVSLTHVTAANQWAVDVAIEAGLSTSRSGHLAVRGMSPPAPYIHHGALL